MAGGPGRARQARGRAGGAKRGDQEQASRSALGPGGEGVRVRHRRRQENPRPTSSTGTHSCSPTTSCSPPLHARRLPGCTSLGDGLDGSLVHLSHRDVTLLCLSRAPIERLSAYKRRMGWQFPCVSTYSTDFAFDFGLALTEEQAEQIPELQELTGNPPGWLQEWSGQIGAKLTDGLRENPGWIAFARRTGPSTTPTRSRRRTRSSRPTSAYCSSERRKHNPPSPAAGGRMSTRSDADRVGSRLITGAAVGRGPKVPGPRRFSPDAGRPFTSWLKHSADVGGLAGGAV
jgi:Bacterial protein of unknown function (DUF899)